jgi:hypothetical protein
MNQFNMYPYTKHSSSSKGASNFHHEMRESRELFCDGKDKFAAGEFQGALENFQQSVRMHEVLFGKYHSETITSYWWVGKTACKVSQKTQALKAFQRATRMAESGMDGATYQEICRDIEESWREAFDGNILKLLDQIFTHERRADKALKGRHYLKAIENYCQALTLQDSLLGEDSLDGADIRCKLAFSLLKTSARPEAQKTLQAAYTCYLNEIGPDHPATYGAAAKIKAITAITA